jgi:hypothetical protein
MIISLFFNINVRPKRHIKIPSTVCPRNLWRNVSGIMKIALGCDTGCGHGCGAFPSSLATEPRTLLDVLINAFLLQASAGAAMHAELLIQYTNMYIRFAALSLLAKLYI